MRWMVALILILGPGSESEEVRVPIDRAGRVDLAEVVQRLAEGVAGRVERPGPCLLKVRGIPGAYARGLILRSLDETASVSVGLTDLVVTMPKRPTAEQVRALADRVRDEIPEGRLGMTARPSYRPNDPDRPTICLVHGINSTAHVFAHLVPSLEKAGFGIVLYEYPTDRGLEASSKAFAKDWAEFRRDRGETAKWAVLTHSMGALLARRYVEGDAYGGDVSHLLLIGPTNHGAMTAKVQPLIRLARAVEGGGRVEAAVADLDAPEGEASRDLLPDSAFLAKLNARPRRAGVPYHILAGSGGFLTRAARGRVEARVALATKAGGLLGGISKVAAGTVAAGLDEMTEGTGDGCVAVASTRLDGVTDHETLPVDHVELGEGPPALPRSRPGGVRAVRSAEAQGEVSRS